MLNHHYDPLRGFSLDGTPTHVSLGWLRTPDEFALDCLSLVQRPQMRSWAVATQMPDATVNLLQSPLVPNASALILMTSASGIRYPVVTLQSASLQVRLMMSLANAATQDWLRDVLADGTINVALEIPEVRQLAVIGMPCEGPPAEDVEEIIDRCPVPTREGLVRDAAQMAHRLAQLDAVPSILKEFQTEAVRLVLVLEDGAPAREPTPAARSRVLN